jgi:twitching motility two-component system response regulator PilH
MSKILLIIEDDPYVQRFYERLFRWHDYAVELAKDGEEGITKAKALKPSLILLDIVLPGMNGIQILEKLKKDPETKNLSIVMLTNIDDEATVKKAVELGAIDFIVKSSASEEQLLAVVDKYFTQAENLKPS